jgi:cytochrome oxidase Cu insertion factor (SCO1/SenC/PrrC family)
MKRTFYLVPFLVVLTLLSACRASGTEESPVDVVDPGQSATEPIDEPMVEPKAENNVGSTEQPSPQPPRQEAEQEIIDEMADQPTEMAADISEDNEMVAGTSNDEQMTDNVLDDDMGVVDLPVWQTLLLTDARTGEPFTLADFGGKTVFVEPMATWCSNCRRQLTNVQAAKQQLNSDDVVFIALSVETNIDNPTLASYANKAGFDWLFAVMTPELLRQMADDFGQSITNPPATPHFIIQPDGRFTELVTGVESADQIISQIQAAQG